MSSLSSEKLTKLCQGTKTYDLQLNVGAPTMLGQKNGLTAVTAVLAIFEHKENGPIVVRKTSASAEAKTLESAQNKALDKVLTLAGVV